MRQFIWVTGQYEGFHRWALAPQEVCFLRNEHRHIFKWKVSIEVFHYDRELEFFLVKKDIRIIIHSMMLGDLGSCEAQADYICAKVMGSYPNRRIIVEVSEDGENGATVEGEPDNIGVMDRK